MVSVEDLAGWEVLHQWVYDIGHEISPIDNVAILHGLAKRSVSVRPHKNLLPFLCNQNLPRLNDDGFRLFRTVDIRRGSHFEKAELPRDVPFGEVESQKLIDVVRILIQRFGVQIHILQKRSDDLLELLVHQVAQLRLHNPNHVVVLLHPQHDLIHPGYHLCV